MAKIQNHVILTPSMHKHARSGTAVSKASTSTRQPEGSGDSNEHQPLLPRIGHALQANPAARYTNSSNVAVKYTARFVATTWEVIKSNYANVLLVFVPLGIVGGIIGWDPVTVFVLNFLAIVPLAGLLSFATEELSAKLGQTLGGLVNATFGNAVELIVSIIALKEGQIRIVQSSMLGSILSNMLLVLGCCFIAGGISHHEQEFAVVVAQTMSSLMAIASASLILPATMYATLRDSKTGKVDPSVEKDVLALSRGTSIILLILYVLYLYFQLRSHADLFVDDTESANASGGNASGGEGQNGDADGPQDQAEHNESEADSDSGEKKEGDTLTPIPAGVALVLITICVAICAEYLVDSIDAIVERAHISKTFIGLILLPIVGNAPEHVTAVVVSFKNKMNLALGVAIGSSLQIALFVTPALVLLGWAIGQPMSLRFETFETVVFFISVLVVNYLIQDGKSNYLEGCMCLGTYILVAMAFYIYPDNAADVGSLVKSITG